MATRTVDQWGQYIDDTGVAKGLGNSAAAEWKAYKDTSAQMAYDFENILERFYSDVQAVVDTKQPGNIYSVPDLVKAFQYGDSLLVEKGRSYYAVDDATKRIVKQVSVRETPEGVLLIKVSKDDGSGNDVQLANDERAALKSYLDIKLSPGTDFSLYSLPNDFVKYTVTIRYNPAINTTELNTALLAARDSFKTNFDFNAKFFRSQFAASLQGVTGVKSVVPVIDITLNDGTLLVSGLVDFYELPAGYFNWHVDSAFTLIADL